MRPSIYYIFATLACIFALFAITRKNPVHSALMLVLSLLSLSVVYLAIGAVFLAMAQIFVYAGAIMVLFVFVLMLIGTRPDEIGKRTRDGWGLGLLAAISCLLVFLVKYDFRGGALRIVEVGPAELAGVLVGVGSELGEHALAFELGSVLVLVAIVGALLLTRKGKGS